MEQFEIDTVLREEVWKIEGPERSAEAPRMQSRDPFTFHWQLQQGHNCVIFFLPACFPLLTSWGNLKNPQISCVPAEEALVLKWVQGRRETRSGNNTLWQWKGRKAGRPVLGPLQERKGSSGETKQPSVVSRIKTLATERPVFKPQPHPISWPKASTFFWTKCTKKWKFKKYLAVWVLWKASRWGMLHLESRVSPGVLLALDGATILEPLVTSH